MAYLRFADRISSLRPTAVNRVLQEVRQLQAEQTPARFADARTARHANTAAYRRGGRKALRDGRTGYPDNQGEPALRRAVALKLKREQGLSYDPDREILITDGATLGVCAALGAMVDQRRSVMLPDPIYDAYEAPIALWGSSPAPIRRNAAATDDLRSAASSLEAHGSPAPTSSCSIHPGTRWELS